MLIGSRLRLEPMSERESKGTIPVRPSLTAQQAAKPFNTSGDPIESEVLCANLKLQT
jgi:hypothetical protein